MMVSLAYEQPDLSYSTAAAQPAKNNQDLGFISVTHARQLMQRRKEKERNSESLSESQ